MASSSSTRTEVVDVLTNVFGSYVNRGRSDSLASSATAASLPQARKVFHGLAAAPPLPPPSGGSTASKVRREAFDRAEHSQMEEVWTSARQELAERNREREAAKMRAEAEFAQFEEKEESLRDGLKRQLLDERDRGRFLELQLAEKLGEHERLRLSYSDCLTKLTETLKVSIHGLFVCSLSRAAVGRSALHRVAPATWLFERRHPCRRT